MWRGRGGLLQDQTPHCTPSRTRIYVTWHCHQADTPCRAAARARLDPSRGAKWARSPRPSWLSGMSRSARPPCPPPPAVAPAGAGGGRCVGARLLRGAYSVGPRGPHPWGSFRVTVQTRGGRTSLAPPPLSVVQSSQWGQAPGRERLSTPLLPLCLSPGEPTVVTGEREGVYRSGRRGGAEGLLPVVRSGFSEPARRAPPCTTWAARACVVG